MSRAVAAPVRPTGLRADASPSRRLLLCGAGALTLATIAGCATKPKGPPANGADQTATVLPLINDLRAKRGLSPLSYDPAAARAAEGQAIRMAEARKMAHLIGLTDTFLGRMKGAGVALPAAENIAAGQQSPEAAYQAWVDSPKHLENMLGPYRGLGVALARTADGRPYWAMVLSNAG
ncbi:CAP domain-containing protein [Rhizobium sp. SG2393]|uniref:CAP domain-containing protein n=1 Tax=Rhizobium sp. SG2393 TaxID=3276279 RepID=UPI00366EF76A